MSTRTAPRRKTRVPGAVRASAARSGASAFARLAFVWALLVALTWQSFVLQTHRHLETSAPTSAVTSLVSVSADSQKQAPADTPFNCPMCREVASAGAALLPTPATVEAPTLTAFFIAPPQALLPSRAQPSHRWQSRAPPLPRLA